MASSLAISLLLIGPKASPDVGGFEIKSSYKVSTKIVQKLCAFVDIHFEKQTEMTVGLKQCIFAIILVTLKCIWKAIVNFLFSVVYSFIVYRNNFIFKIISFFLF